MTLRVFIPLHNRGGGVAIGGTSRSLVWKVEDPRSVERMLSRRCYRSTYLLACEPSDRSRLMARSVMNVAARGHGNHGFLVPQIQTSLCPEGSVALSYARVRTRRPYALLSIWLHVYEACMRRISFPAVLWCRPVTGFTISSTRKPPLATMLQ